MMQQGAFNEIVNNYTQSGFITVQQNCFAYSVTNLGNAIATFNDHVLFPSSTPATIAGDSISIVAPNGEEYKGQMKLSFGAGATPLVSVTQLYYIKPTKI